MDTTTSTLKTLNRFSPFQVRSSRTHLLRPLCLSHFKLKHHLCSSSSHRFLPFCALSERGGEGSLPRGVGEAIPGNTGCIARTCAASAVGLHLVGPLGFQVDDAKLKRAGLDYWPYVVVKVHNSWADFQDYFRKQEGEKRLLAFTKRGTAIHSVNPMSLAHELHFLSFSVSFFVASENMVYSRARGIFDNEGQFFNGILQDFSYKRGDHLLFGSETSGLPPEALLDCKNQPFGGGTIRIPMVETYVRCLNLSVSVGIALYEASRQLNYEQLQFPPEGCSYSNEQSFITEDLFA